MDSQRKVISDDYEEVASFDTTASPQEPVSPLTAAVAGNTGTYPAFTFGPVSSSELPAPALPNSFATSSSPNFSFSLAATTATATATATSSGQDLAANNLLAPSFASSAPAESPACAEPSTPAIVSDTLRKACSNCAKKASLVCGGCRSAKYCSAECQKSHWTTSHKASCRVLCSVQTMFDASKPWEERLAILKSNELDDASVYAIVLAAVPTFYTDIYKLVQEDLAILQSIPSAGSGYTLPGLWTSFLLCGLFRRINSGSAPNKFRGVTPMRFTPFLECNVDVWLTIMRVLQRAILLLTVRKENRLRRMISDVFRSVSQAVASRPIASFILVNHMEGTSKILKQIYTSITNDRNDLSHGPGLALTPIIFETIGVLDIWCSLFFLHGLPGRGSDGSHFARACGIIDDQMFTVSRQVSKESLLLVNDSSDLLQEI